MTSAQTLNWIFWSEAAKVHLELNCHFILLIRSLNLKFVVPLCKLLFTAGKRTKYQHHDRIRERYSCIFFLSNREKVIHFHFSCLIFFTFFYFEKKVPGGHPFPPLGGARFSFSMCLCSQLSCPVPRHSEIIGSKLVQLWIGALVR